MIKDKNIICIIPARGGSKGIIKKSTIDLNGKPLIAWSIDVALKSKYLKDSVYVTSDSDNILSVSKEFGAKTIKRPSIYATDTATTESALLHAISEIEKNIENKIDAVVFLQPTSPIRETIDINSSIEMFFENSYDSLFSACEIDDFLIWKRDINGNLISINYDFENRKRRQDFEEQYVENGSIYIFKPSILIDKKNRIGGKIGTYIMEKYKMFEIDKLQDIPICEFFMKKCQ
jgi:N-acylneuraminate cytidylyltransferase